MKLKNLDWVRIGKVAAALGLVFTSAVTVNYELGVKGYYETHPETLNGTIEMLENYSKRNGCISPKKLFYNSDFGYLESWYLLSEATKTNHMIYYKGEGACPNPFKIVNH